MDILISFTTSVGVIESFRAVKNVAVDIVNQSIVMWLKNKKIENPGEPDRPLNNREVNRKGPPFLGLPGQFAYIKTTKASYLYKFNRYSWNWTYEQEYTYSINGSYTYKTVSIFAGVELPSETNSGSSHIGYDPTTYRKTTMSGYNPNSIGSFSRYTSSSDYHDAGNPNWPEGGGEPPGTMLGGESRSHEIVTSTVSFGD